MEPGTREALETRRNVDAVAHKVTIRLFDDITQMDTDAQLEPTFRRQADVAFDHAGLEVDRTSRSVDNATEFRKHAITRALDDPTAVNRDRWIDEIATKSANASESAVFVSAGQPTEPDQISNQDRSKLARLAHCSPRTPR